MLEGVPWGAKVGGDSMVAVKREKKKVGVGVNVVVGVGVIVDVRVGVMVGGMDLAVCVCAA